MSVRSAIVAVPTDPGEMQMTDQSFATEMESYLKTLSSRLTSPRSGECLVCYVARMLDEFGCDETLRWARRFRDARAPRATRLVERLQGMGGFCDCEILLNGYARSERLARTNEALLSYGRTPICLGVPGGSTRPCGAWDRRG